MKIICRQIATVVTFTLLLLFSVMAVADSSTTDLSNNLAAPGFVLHAYLAGTRALEQADSPIVNLLNNGRYTQAIPLLKIAAKDKKNAWAAATLGHLYQSGLGVPLNLNQSFEWYLQAAREGDSYAKRQVSNAYLNGRGVPPDLRLASFWSPMSRKVSSGPSLRWCESFVPSRGTSK